MKIGHFILLLLLSLATPAVAQTLHIDSTRFITGDTCCTYMGATIPTRDKGLFFAGFTTRPPGGIFPPSPYAGANVFVGKIDSNRLISWVKIYGGNGDDGAVSAVETPDGGYGVLCSTASADGDVTGYKGNSDMWLIRLDSAGNLLWEKCYGSSATDGPISIDNAPGHGFILMGQTDGSDGDVPFHYGYPLTDDWLVVKTDSVGTVQWSKDLGGSEDDGTSFGGGIRPGSILTVDSFYFLVSCTSSTDHDCTDTAWHAGAQTLDDYYVLKLDKSGNVLWAKSYGGSGDDEVSYAMFDSRDSTIVIIGTTTSPNDYMVTGEHTCPAGTRVGDGDMWVLKINRNGGLLWQKCLGSRQDEWGTGICAGPHGGYLAYGQTATIDCYDSSVHGIGSDDCWLFALDSAGNMLTNKVFGGTGLDNSYSIIPYLDGYVATGISASHAFTEGTTYGNPLVAFISYLGYAELSIQSIAESSNNVLAYPDPVINIVNITLPESSNGTLTIINTIGQIVYRAGMQHGKTTLQTAAWNAGLYIVCWQGEDGLISTTRFIKQ